MEDFRGSIDNLTRDLQESFREREEARARGDEIVLPKYLAPGWFESPLGVEEFLDRQREYRIMVEGITNLPGQY